MEKVKVIVVDDSAFMRKAISDIIESEDNFEVIAKFRDGRELVDKVDKFNPDIITLDVHMKDLDGLSTLKELKRLGKSYSIIMLSSATTNGSELTLECLDNGAISFITKPSGSISLDIAKVKENLISQIKGIMVNKRRDSKTYIHNNMTTKQKVKFNIQKQGEVKCFDDNQRLVHRNENIILPNKRINAVVIGASTGGPKALQRVLVNLPKNLGIPVFVVQHMPEGFTKVFSERLNRVCQMNVVEAEDGMNIDNGTIYIAKGGSHMTIGDNNKICFNQEPPVWGVRPAVDKLFDSAIKVYGSNILSVVLTGMGRDGAAGTENIKDNGGITIAEDKSTCTIYGMPKAAFETGKVDLVLPLDQVCDNIIKIVKRI